MLITIYTSILGLITGLTYSWALGFHIEDGLLYGLTIGVTIGLFLLLLKKAVTARNTVTKTGTIFISNYLMVLLLLVSVGSGLIVWIFRVAIF